MSVTRAFISRVVQPGDAAKVVLLGVVVALLEGAGVLLLVPLLALVGLDVGTGAVGDIAAAVGGLLSALGIGVTLGAVLLVYVALVTIQAALTRAEAITAVRVRETVASRMRTLLYTALTRMRWRLFLERHSSVYVHALTTQLDRAQFAIAQSLMLLSQLLIVLVYAVIALRIAPLLSALALAGGALLVLVTRGYARALQASGTELTAATQRLHTTVVEHLSNMKVARSYAAERQLVKHFEESSRAVVATWASTGAAFAGSRWVFTVGAAVMLAAVVYVGVTVFGLTAAAVLLLLYVFGRLVPRVGALHQLVQHIVHALPALRMTARELAAYEAAAEPAAPGEDGALPLQRGIRFERVAFSYRAGEPVIRSLSFAIPAGCVTVIVGPSGAGKTTIADLLLGLLGPSEGSIRVDDAELNHTTLGAWRRSVAYVPQEAVLFNDTIRNNLLWAVPAAADADLRGALTAAGAGFALSLPAGLDTQAGERGAWLSGGERQRLAIARALLRRPQLLVLDEPTSNLDAENEQRLLETLRSLRGSVTIVVISHREAALSVADQVLVVQGGRLLHSTQVTAAPGERSAALA